MFSIRHRSQKIGLAIISVFLAVNASAESPAENPDFARRVREIKSISVLPPEVEFVRIGANGTQEHIGNREDEIARELFDGVKVRLEEKNYSILTTDASLMEGKDNKVIVDLRASYASAAKHLLEKSDDASGYKLQDSGAATALKSLAMQRKGDALLIIRYAGYERSAGAVTSDAIVGVLFAAMTGMGTISAPRGFALEAILIDGSTGDILWANKITKRPVVRKSDAHPGETGLGIRVMEKLPNTEKK